jgi:hypothetical protein
VDYNQPIMKLGELLQSLSEGQVRYVLVGGLAVQLHGFQRSTFDVDLVLAMDDANLSRFIAVAKRHGLVPTNPVAIESLKDRDLLDQWRREKGMLAFALREPQAGGNAVDVVIQPEVPFEQLLANAVAGQLFSFDVPIASVDDLLTMKRAANRPKDQLDVAALEKIKRGENPNA